MPTCISPVQVQEAFLAAPPAIASQILDLSLKHPNWLRDVFDTEVWDTGNGTVMEQIVFRAQMPQIERGFANWKRLGNTSGCAPCAGPDCSYNWSPLGGHGFERKTTELMSREYRSPDYCIAEIQTTAQFAEVFAKIVENLYRQIDFIKAENIGHNGLISLSKKYVIDAGGPKPNTEFPYAYPNVGAVVLGMLNVDVLEFFYEEMVRMPDVIPYDVVDGAPIYALEASRQLLSHMWRDDPGLRQDLRFSGFANDLVTKYNFMSSIRGQFIPAPIPYPRRGEIVAGEFVETLPFLNDIPLEFGSYTGINPAYQSATYEEVMVHGRMPFKIWHMPTEESLGGGTSFGPEFSFLENLMWVNPQTTSDPFRRVGYFATSAKIGFNAQHSEGIFAILVPRPSVRAAILYQPVAVCPPTPVDCDNEIPVQGCPCPLIASIVGNPITSGAVTPTYFFTFASEVTGTPGGPVQLALDNGAYITGTLVLISADGLTAEISFTTPLTNGVCTNVVGIFCDDTLGCSAFVDSASDCRGSVSNSVAVVLSNAIKAFTAGDVVIAYFGDCTTAEMTVESVDLQNMTWVLAYNTGFGPTDDPTGAVAATANVDLLCNRKGFQRICVPPTTDATCPACEVTVESCVEPEEG